MLDGNLDVSCNTSTGPNASTTIGVVIVPAFHGSDTYTFSGSTDPTGGSVQFELGGYLYDTSTSGQPAATCTIDVTGPAAPQKGDAVAGTFHCDGVTGIPDHGGTQVTTSVDGKFDGAMTL